MIWTYIIIAVLLLAAVLIYFRIADKCNILISRMRGRAVSTQLHFR